MSSLSEALPLWVAKLPFNVQVVIGVAVLAHIAGLLLALTWALKSGSGGSKGRAPFSAELKVKNK